jgi:hypothetical protein
MSAAEWFKWVALSNIDAEEQERARQLAAATTQQ